MSDRSAPVTTREIIAYLGGGAEVGAWLNCSRAVISNWHATGIAKTHWADLIEMAEAKKLQPALTTATLRAASNLARAERAARRVAGGRRRGRPSKQHAGR